ncbi:MAG: CinA family protein [Methanomassiliicoccales archaeon]|nr:CinA family protein [Methanomassiliicoccales archaeon]NYT15427.1 CinA family protein [Methanomassiliicoccales archaeon]
MIAEKVGELLRAKSITLAVAESFTGGLVSNMITDAPGSSEYFLVGLVTYSNDSKKSLLGVKESTMIEYGTVSEEVAREMAIGVKEIAGADMGLSTTGIAGPSGGTEEKPVGLTYIGLSYRSEMFVEKMILPGSREEIKRAAAIHALDKILQVIECDE